MNANRYYLQRFGVEPERFASLRRPIFDHKRTIRVAELVLQLLWQEGVFA